MEEVLEHKYIEVADRIEKLIEKEVLKVGDRLLSVRALSKEQGISLSTSFKAYYHLESKGLIEARPQSGYFVKFIPNGITKMPQTCDPPESALPVSIDEMITQVYKELNTGEKLVNFTLSTPAIELLPAAKLNKSVVQALRESKTSCLNYDEIQGNIELRKQIARQSFNWGGVVTEEDVVITAGCMEAMALCLKAVTKPGDAVAIESPTYFGIFQVMESLGLKVVEIPTNPATGLDLQDLENAIDRFDIKACLFVNNFNNPMGSCMPDDIKKKLVEMLSKREIPLIEDDIYGELYFSKQRPGSCKRFDKKGLVLYCSSFSKSLAPGYRIGWVIPGKFKKEIIRLKRMNTISTNTLAQSALAHFLKNGRYELHLRHLRKALHTQSLRYIQAITKYFPSDICFTQPQGGFVLWIELNSLVDTYKLYKKALKHNIGIAPGKMFSSQNRFDNCFRLSYGEPWSDRIEKGIRQLGNLIKEM